jgi:uncharacterized membrane protein affecting hemolysin expression
MRAGPVIAAFALLLVLLVGAGWYGSAQHTRAVAAEGQASTLAKDLEAAKARTARIQAGVNKVEAERDAAKQGLAQALARSGEWGAMRTPDPVISELCKRLRCTSVQPMPTP